MRPLGRPSRQRTVRPPFVDVPNVAANATAASGVNPWPIIPRIPETLTIRLPSCAIMFSAGRTSIPSIFD
jgi:hypothetical protein